MASAKIAITMNERTLHRLDRLVKERVLPNRSKAIQDAVEEKLEKLERDRLARELQSLIPLWRWLWLKKVWVRDWSSGRSIEGRDSLGRPESGESKGTSRTAPCGHSQPGCFQ